VRNPSGARASAGSRGSVSRWSFHTACIDPTAPAFLTDSRVAILLTLLVPLVWVRHHANIRRLLNGTEPKIGQRSEASTSGV
jgi:glycerol-3-phosphate acyltransferase PlsY